MAGTKAYETTLIMLKRRNYEIIETEDDKIIAQKPDGNQMAVFFLNTPKFDISCMKEIISMMGELEIVHSIVVYEDGVTATTKKTIEQSLDIKIEFFSQKDLQYDITQHRLQPKSFDKLSDVDAEAFKKKYGTKLDVMRITDPITLFFDYRRGDIIKVTRKNGYVTYRIVR